MGHITNESDIRYHITSAGSLSWESETGEPSVRKWKVLFSRPRPLLGVFLENWTVGSSVCRITARAWEEIFVFQGAIENSQTELKQPYLALAPGDTLEGWRFASPGSGLLRFIYEVPPERGSSTDTASLQQAWRSRLLTPERFVWNEIPARRPHDPGGRVAELSRINFIVVLMECNPGWVLDEHQHPSEVLTYCIRGGGTLGRGNIEDAFYQEQLVRIPAEVPHSFKAGPDGALLLILVLEPQHP